MPEEQNEALLEIKTKDRHKVVPASYFILRDQDKVLLLRRFNTGYEDGKYSLPAGHVDAGETFTEALVREVEEEIGITLELQDVRVAHIMHRKSIDSERVDAFFVAEKWSGEPKNMEPHKCDDLSWYSLSELPVNIIPYVRQALECVHNGKFYSEFGF
jgi:8-oxo-dGTP diphosphatase